MPYPEIPEFRVCRQRPVLEAIPDIDEAVLEQMKRMVLDPRPGARVAIGVGSRGIANLDRIIRSVTDFFRVQGFNPFIVPAMGSHGGATAEGQVHVLESYGIRAESMQCPVLSSMEVVELPSGGLEHPLFMDRIAWESDAVFLVNRIKPHTDFHGRYESGLMKMMVIGLGKERQASIMHRYGVRGLRDLMPKAAHAVLQTGKVIGGLAVVENALDQTAIIESMHARDIPEREPVLLEKAGKMMPSLPFDSLDILVLDQIGKDISGTGMDTNVVGRIRIPGEPEPISPRISRIVVSDLSAASDGNATGMGLADIVCRRLASKIDHEATLTNIITSGFLERGKLPVVVPNDRAAIHLAIRSLALHPHRIPAIARFRNTLQLEYFMASQSLLDLAESGSTSAVPFDTGPLVPDPFDEDGYFIPWEQIC